MSWKVSKGFDITMTRGDTPSFVVGINIKTESGERVPYVPLETDTVVFAMKTIGGTTPILTKTIPVDTLVLQLEESDTKTLDFGEYTYEISLNSGSYHCTFLPERRLVLTDEIW